MAGMRLNVAQLLKTSIGATRSYELNDSIDINGGGDRRQIEGKVELTRLGRGVLVKGVFQTDAEITCSRCLSPFIYPVALNIVEEYFPVTDIVNSTPLPLPDEPGCFTIDEHFILDLTEAIRQYALLAIPMKPLCREDCAGLCPSCGHNLNLGDCNCLPPEVDPRWTKLSKLANKLKRNGVDYGTFT